jgi:hypothetical protein
MYAATPQRIAEVGFFVKKQWLCTAVHFYGTSQSTSLIQSITTMPSPNVLLLIIDTSLIHNVDTCNVMHLCNLWTGERVPVN